MIQMFHVYKNYSPKYSALSDISLKIEKGEFVFIFGPSGAGKSTLLKLILGAEHPSKGQIIVNGMNFGRIKKSTLPLLRRRMGFVFQDFKLLNHRTVFDNVGLALEVVGLKKTDIKRKVQQVLKHVGLLSRINTVPLVLSGGEQQRVAIARAIVNEPALLLADEPTGNLDAELTKEIMKLFKIINAWGTTIVIATHDKNLLNFNPTKVVALEKGKIKGVFVPGRKGEEEATAQEGSIN
ncbi:MAG: cell division ATP-binding protein FtsE [Deltaproteobacteria bacterium]|nr:cell division ATP-binding protein FtsE [Deltaproteobacteria bacterium]